MKSLKKLVSLALAAILALTVFASCSSSTNTSSTGQDSGDTIKLGGTFTLTGDLAHSGTLAFEGAKAAVEYVNEKMGGVNGKQVEMIYYDDEFDSGKIPSLYERLISVDNVDLIVSPYTSALLDAAPTVDQYQKMMFSVAADSYEANKAYGQTVANIQMDDQWQGGMWWKDVAEFLGSYDTWAAASETTAKKPSTVAIINLETTYGHEVSSALNTYFEEQGMSIVYEEFFDPGNSDWTPCVSKLKALSPEIVIAPQYFEDSVTFVQSCRSLDFSAEYMVIEGMGWDTASWPNTESGGLDPTIAKMNFLSYSVYKSTRDCETTKYAADYCKEKYGSIPGNDFLCGFMAVELACKAANKAESTEKDALISALTSNTFELAGYDYKMNETGGNCAEFSWGVGQYQPANLSEADVSGDDWQVLWPQAYKTAEPQLPFQGWK